MLIPYVFETSGCSFRKISQFSFAGPILRIKTLGFMAWGFDGVVFGTVAEPSDDTFYVTTRPCLSHSFINRFLCLRFLVDPRKSMFAFDFLLLVFVFPLTL